MNVKAYLQRISVEKESEPTLEFLQKLQKHHMENIPFENLDVTRNVEITLNLSRFYNKIIGDHRGGFCYELNGLFQQLLTKLGFKSHLISCTVKKQNGWAKENTHAAMIVHLDQPYLVDVGFGDSVRKPLPLTGKEQEDVSGIYRINLNENHLFDLQRFENQEWKTLYRFANVPKKLEDFSEGCYFNQTSPESSFTHGDIATIATENGRITLSGQTVTKAKNGVKTKLELTEIEKKKFLEDFFSIRIKDS
ncbi:arylamine N-acetyltransferase family protein [Cytobacillus dafuensis]|uniref:Arylamine N-acetyltransferase n=1 Tax=Cytobacillus dafuensis TaxID=1742359 RepID=A0A5B8Z3L9_CYTDA|nr:arylamine N-acetyltransferase [Cytobacillus dafuensis]QED47702.1 arylamine N-acetyltransferase [Cytobacillus dafuensis]